MFCGGWMLFKYAIMTADELKQNPYCSMIKGDLKLLMKVTEKRNKINVQKAKI